MIFEKFISRQSVRYLLWRYRTLADVTILTRTRRPSSSDDRAEVRMRRLVFRCPRDVSAKIRTSASERLCVRSSDFRTGVPRTAEPQDTPPPPPPPQFRTRGPAIERREEGIGRRRWRLRRLPVPSEEAIDS